jgi:hypothetical protein
MSMPGLSADAGAQRDCCHSARRPTDFWSIITTATRKLHKLSKKLRTQGRDPYWELVFMLKHRLEIRPLLPMIVKGHLTIPNEEFVIEVAHAYEDLRVTFAKVVQDFVSPPSRTI